MDAISEALIKKYPDRKGLIEQSAKEAQFMDMLNGRFRDSGRVADSPGEYLDSVVGAPARTGIDEMQKGHFDLDALKKTLTSVGSDPKNAPTGVDLAYNTGIRNPYLGAAAATAFDLGAQVPVGEIASLGKAGIMGKISDVSPEAILSKYNTVEKATALKGPERAQYLDALDQMHGPRDQRRQDLGFGPETYYHGTDRNFDQFKQSENDIGIHFGTPGQANEIAQFRRMNNGGSGDNVIPVKLKANNPVRTEDLGAWNPDTLIPGLEEAQFAPALELENNIRSNESARSYLESKGKDSIKYFNTEEASDPINGRHDDSMMVLRPDQIRSVNAAFDPRFKDSSNLLAAILGANPMQPGAGLLRARSSQKDNN